jgi:putative heme-binding domain-containing protein
MPYELLTEGGDATRGKTIVNAHLAANCTACHRIDSDEGSEVGPILRYVGAQRTKAEIAESLVEPSAKIVPGFGVETIVLKDGTTLAGGVLKGDAKTLEVRMPDGKTRKVALVSVASRTPPVSLMPPMLGILTPTEIRDVVAYLSGLKPKASKAKAKAKK